MPNQTVTVGSRVGLHARPAALIAEAVGKAGVPVTLATPGGNPVDAGSPLMIMTLGAKQGTEVVVSSDDPAVLDQIAGLVEKAGAALGFDDRQVKADAKKFKEFIESRGTETRAWRGDVPRPDQA